MAALSLLACTTVTVLVLASSGPKQAWSCKTGPIVTTPILVDGMVVFGTADRHLCAVDAQTGKLCWDRRPAKLSYIAKTLVHGNGLVYYLDGSKTLRAVRAENGAQVLKYTSRSDLSTPALWRDKVLLSDGMHLRVLDAHTAERITDIEVADDHVLFTPTVRRDVAFVGYAAAGKKRVYKGIHQGLRGGLYAFDLQNNRVLWRQDHEFMVARAPQLCDGKLLAIEHGAARASIRAVAQQTGKPLWSSARSDTAITFAAGLGWRGTLDPRTNQAQIEGFDLASGEPIRRFAFEFAAPPHMHRDAREPQLTDCVAASGQLYFGCLDQLYCIDAATGDESWRWETAGRVLVAPLVVGDVVLVATTDGFLHAIEG